MLILYPKLILPLFNKLTPLPEGELRTRLLALGDRTGFQAKTIEVIDGSKRSGHSNAYFTGFGRFRRIVLFDTLIAQLTPEELEAVLAHEIGHLPPWTHSENDRVVGGHDARRICGRRVAGAQSVVQRRVWISAGRDSRRRFCSSRYSAGVVTFWFAPLVNLALAQTRVRSGCLCAECHGRASGDDRRAAETRAKKSHESHAAPLVQRLLLFAPDTASNARRRWSGVELTGKAPDFMRARGFVRRWSPWLLFALAGWQALRACRNAHARDVQRGELWPGKSADRRGLPKGLSKTGGGKTCPSNGDCADSVRMSSSCRKWDRGLISTSCVAT